MNYNLINMNAKFYCLGGLIMDDLVFRKLKPKGIDLIHIKYMPHFNHETLKQYAARLFKHVNLPEKYQLLGVSFGGMIAAEFNKIRKAEKLYLVSSVSKVNQVPLKLRVAGLLKMHRMIPRALMNTPAILSSYLFGVQRKKDLDRIKRLLTPSDAEFLKWALEGILKWKNTDVPDAIRIHGSNDKILPCNSNVDYLIKGGSHFIMVNRTDEISKILSTNNEE